MSKDLDNARAAMGAMADDTKGHKLVTRLKLRIASVSLESAKLTPEQRRDLVVAAKKLIRILKR